METPGVHCWRWRGNHVPRSPREFCGIISQVPHALRDSGEGMPGDCEAQKGPEPLTFWTPGRGAGVTELLPSRLLPRHSAPGFSEALPTGSLAPRAGATAGSSLRLGRVIESNHSPDCCCCWPPRLLGKAGPFSTSSLAANLVRKQLEIKQRLCGSKDKRGCREKISISTLESVV